MDYVVFASLKPPKKKFLVVMPYVLGVAKQLWRAFKHYDVAAYFNPSNTIRQCLVHPKNKILKEQVVGPVMHLT